MPAPVFGALVPLVGRVNTAVLAVNQVRWFKWSLFYQEYVAQGYADIHDPAEPGVVVALKIDGTAATYSTLPTTGLTAGMVYVVGDTGRAYVWSGSSWPASNAGIAIQGPRGYTGNGVESVTVAGNSLVFHMTGGEELPPVFLQVLADLQGSVDTAILARDAAIAARSDAELARDDVAEYSDFLNTVVGPQIEELRSETVAARNEAQQFAQQAASATPLATATEFGKIKLRGDFGGTAENPTVPGLTGKRNTVSDAFQVYTTDGSGGQSSIGYSSGVTPSTVVFRDASGRTKVATPAAAADAVTKEYVDTLLAKKANLGADGKTLQAEQNAIAVTDFLGNVASQAAMLALVGQRGDWCNRTDLGTEWQLIAEPSTSLSSWMQKVYPGSDVTSVAGRKGAVTLSVIDVSGAAPLANAALTGAPTVNGNAIIVEGDTRMADARDTTVARVTDASAVGRTLMKANSPSAARDAITAGMPLNERGAWSSASGYNPSDVVTYNYGRWYAKSQISSSATFDPSRWIYLGLNAIAASSDPGGGQLWVKI